MTHITILCGGSRGDNQPYIALGEGLRVAGYRVRVATDREFEPLAASYGLEFVSTGEETRALVENHMAGLMTETNPFKAIPRLRAVMPLLKAAEERQTRAQWEACQGAEAIIGHVLYTAFGLSMAKKLGVPFFEADVKPVAPTRSYPNAAMPPLRLGGSFNMLTHRLFEQSMWQAQRASINRWRNDLLGLPPLPFGGYHGQMEQSRVPRLCGVSPHVIPRPPDWADNVHLTGYWFLEQAEAYELPAALAEFLAAGPPPVCVGFGSMPSPDPQAATALIVKALEMAHQRGILLGGWGGLADSNLPPTVLHIESAPHDWLFPRIAAVVHHGGAGTLAASLRAGIPSIVIPLLGDQPFWGRRVHELGVGPKPIPRKRLTAEWLAEAIRIAVSDRAMRDRAAALGEKIRAEDGVGKAVEIIKRAL